jgi:EKC/KEOPS complex subunit PCC1/LAGE3
MSHSTPPLDLNFPCSLILSLPFPTHRLASTALQALQVDAELSPLVQRSFSLTGLAGEYSKEDLAKWGEETKTVLEVSYKATTNRMLRVAVNGFMESLGVVLKVMEELDVDVLPPKP